MAEIKRYKVENSYLHPASIPRYEWVGSIADIVKVDSRWLKELPWPIEVLDYSVLDDCYTIQRLDHGCYAWNRLMADIDKFADWWRIVQMQMILTLSVWNLAYVPRGCIPSWVHVGKQRPY